MYNNTIQDDQCVICTHNYTKGHSHRPTALGCGHFFGRSCIVEWEKIDRTCPLCRQHFAIPKDPPDTNLTTQINKQFHSNKLSYCLLAGFFYLNNFSTLEIASWHALFGAMSLGTYGAIRACSPIVNFIYGCLGSAPPKPLQLREVKLHGILCTSVIIGSSIASKLTINA